MVKTCVYIKFIILQRKIDQTWTFLHVRISVDFRGQSLDTNGEGYRGKKEDYNDGLFICDMCIYVMCLYVSLYKCMYYTMLAFM